MSKHLSHFFIPVPESEIVDWETLKPQNKSSPISDRVTLWKGDITRLRIPSIVAAANRELAGCWQLGHCIDAAIFSAAGPELFSACKPLSPCEVGEAKITPGFLLPSDFVIHTVGPQITAYNHHSDGVTKQEIQRLTSCYKSVLEIAKKNGIRGVAFCCISTGVFGFSQTKAAHVALSTVRKFLSSPENLSAFDLIVFNVFTERDREIYQDLWRIYFSPSGVHQNRFQREEDRCSNNPCSPCLSSSLKSPNTHLSEHKIKKFSNELLTFIKWIQEADSVLICAGAGMSSYPGLNPYVSSEDFLRSYPGMIQYEYSTSYDCMGLFQDPTVPPHVKWGYQLTHIFFQRYKHQPHRGYIDLLQLVNFKVSKQQQDNPNPYFVYTSNVDGYFERVGFDKNQIYTPQGDWDRYQCMKPCSKNSVWKTSELLEKYLHEVDTLTTSLPTNLSVPSCPSCGGTVFGNVRGGEWFIHSHYQDQQKRFIKWVEDQKEKNKKVLIIEIGAGFNTPIVTRLPMESIHRDLSPNSKFVRLNPTHPQVPSDFENSLSFPLGWEVIPTIISSLDQTVLQEGDSYCIPKNQLNPSNLQKAELLALDSSKNSKVNENQKLPFSRNVSWKQLITHLS